MPGLAEGRVVDFTRLWRMGSVGAVRGWPGIVAALLRLSPDSLAAQCGIQSRSERWKYAQGPDHRETAHLGAGSILGVKWTYRDFDSQHSAYRDDRHIVP